MTLVIMAAGMGSRFGGLKQVEPVGPNGEFILDYSVYDAIKAGFTKVVFIIKEENYDLFRETVGKRVESKINVEYAFQKLEDVPDFVNIPENRVKPWGTSHAILSSEKYVNEPFMVINADDFYGFDPYKKIKEYFDNNKNNNEYVMIGYNVKNTLTENGAVKRGVCSTNESNNLVKLVESSVEEKNGEIIATPLDDKIPSFKVDSNTLVSMNVWGFNPSLYSYLNVQKDAFFKDNEEKLESCEFLLPTSIFELIEEGKVKVNVIDTDEKWFGITYKEDKESLVNSINKMIEDGKYPRNLWN